MTATELTPKTIKKALKDAGVTQADIAVEAGVKRQTVNLVVKYCGQIRSQRIEQVITHHTGLEFPPLKRRQTQQEAS